MPDSTSLALTIAFWTALVCGVLLLWVLFRSIAWPEQRIWPPPEDRAGWQFWLVWVLIVGLVTAIVTVGVQDFGSLGLDGWIWRAAGGILFVLGNLLAWWGVSQLGAVPTTGLHGEFITGGLYRCSRNPQYLGDTLIIAGFVLAANSWLAVWPSLLALACIIGAPFAEEPWLESRFGEAYRTYKKRVPRFLGPI